MEKDIFIDTNIASKFSNPLDPEYKKLIQWLIHYNPKDAANKHNYALLMVSDALLKEYLSGSQGTKSDTNTAIIINRLVSEGRLKKLGNREIDEFKANHFKKKVVNKLTCNHEDRELLPVVLLSHRKYALTHDEKLTFDLINFPGFTVTVAKRPQNLPYDQ